MKRKHVTVVLVPDGSAKIRSFRISMTTIKFLVIIVPVVAFVAMFFLGDLLAPVFGKDSFPSLRAENLALRAKFERLSGTVEELRRIVSTNFDFQKKARLLADLEPIDEEESAIGVGAPESLARDPLAGFEPALWDRVRDTEQELDQLVRQAQLQRESMEEVVSQLEGRRELWKRTPSINPVPGGFKTSGFGRRIDPFTGTNSSHEGVDICAPKGTPILAPADGVVRFAGKRAGYGITISIDHGRGITTWFAHVGTLKVARGQSVKRGQTIATVGASGRATAPHVHYEVRSDGAAMDPARYMLPGTVIVD